METAELKKFARFARHNLIQQVSTKLKAVLAEGSTARRESAKAVRKLEEVIKNNGKKQVIERVAYIWFSIFCALRFMDVNRYTGIGVVTPSDEKLQPGILANAIKGYFDGKMVDDKTQQKINALLNGRTPSHDPQSEAYHLLLVATCSYWHRTMRFLFEPIDDHTELLLPDDLLSDNSILVRVREVLTPGTCENVETIGWLYQFYISEKKNEVFAEMSKNKKVTPENIPAATQAPTQHWLVRYLVENSLGRLWMLNYPNSKLNTKMDYYVKPKHLGTDFLRIGKPEEIKFCDPVCGSGHILTYAFDLMHAIYEEEGYESAEIPEKILTHNLYGIESDERIASLAVFALTMKAHSRQRNFFHKQLEPNICVLENFRLSESELKHHTNTVTGELFSDPLLNTLSQFKEAEQFGSLNRPGFTHTASMLKTMGSKDDPSSLLLSKTHKQILQVLRQADYLSPKYHVVITSPTYVSGKNMNKRLTGWRKGSYPGNKPDLFAMFIECNLELAVLMQIDYTYGNADFSFLDSTGQMKPVPTLEEKEYPQYYHKTIAGSEDGEIESAEPSSTPLVLTEFPLPSEPEVKHLTFQENQKGVSFDILFGSYLTGATTVTVTDPYIRLFYQTRNFMEFLETVVKHKAPDEEVDVHLATIEDESRGEQQRENFEKMKESATAIGVNFTWKFEGSRNIHARHIVTDTGWKISLDRGLDIFQHYEMNDTFAFANRLQQHRPCKKFEVHFVRFDQKSSEGNALK